MPREVTVTHLLWLMKSDIQNPKTTSHNYYSSIVYVTLL